MWFHFSKNEDILKIAAIVKGTVSGWKLIHSHWMCIDYSLWSSTMGNDAKHLSEEVHSYMFQSLITHFIFFCAQLSNGNGTTIQ